MAKEYPGPADGNNVSGLDHPGHRVEPPQLLYTKRCREVEQLYRERHNTLVRNNRIESFDFMASGRPDDEYRVISCRCDGSLEVLSLRPQPPRIGFGIKGEVSLLASKALTGLSHGGASCVDLRPPFNKGTTTAQILHAIRAKVTSTHAQHEPAKGRTTGSFPRRVDLVLSSREARLQALHLASPAGSLFDMGDVLALGTVERRRAEEGYLFDPALNIKILSDDPGLQDLWRWIQGMPALSFTRQI